MRWRDANKAGGVIGKRRGGSNCVLRVIGEFSKRGTRRVARSQEDNQEEVLARRRAKTCRDALKKLASCRCVYAHRWQGAT